MGGQRISFELIRLFCAANDYQCFLNHGFVCGGNLAFSDRVGGGGGLRIMHYTIASVFNDQ